MASGRVHIIRRQILDIDVEGTEGDGHALQRRLPGLCQNTLMASLEAVFDRMVPEDEYWTIDRLDIDAGTLRPDTFERGLVDAVTQEVERYFRDHAPRGGLMSPTNDAGLDSTSAPVARRSEGQSLLRAFLHFLHTGVLPWWFHAPAGRTLEDLIRESWEAGTPESQPRDLLIALRDAIAAVTVRTRLVRQFSPAFLDTLLAANSPECACAVRDVVAELTGFDIARNGLERVVEQVWQAAFLMASAGERPTAETLVVEALKATRPDTELLRALPRRFAGLVSDRDSDTVEAIAGVSARERHDLRRPAMTPKGSPPAGDDDVPRIDLDEGVHVNCAGLILLHPFLPRLFEAVGIAGEGALLEPERAVALLHFLATGRRVAPEYELALPKVLCNMPLEIPAASPIDLTSAEEEEAAALLAAVIRHWDALGDSSADALRHTFLTRAGKLSRRGDDDVLQVETLSFDVLLDRLPWGIGTIQLPWMERMLRVEWRF
jgi:hypothetical protein